MRLEYFSQNTPFQNTVADLGDAPGAPPSPRSKIFSISCSFSQNLAKIYMSALPLPQRWRPLLREILDPPLKYEVAENDLRRKISILRMKLK